MKKLLRILLLLLSVLGLVGIRVLEDNIFYDPFLAFFQGNYKSGTPPVFNGSSLIASHILRFGLNLLFSAGVIYGLFGSLKKLWQTVFLMGIVFALIFPLYYFSIANEMKLGTLYTFYLRRFVIQPLILLLIIPVFYYLDHQQRQQA